VDTFSLYKPFRYAVSTLAIDDSLRVIWAYSQFLQFRDFKFPAAIQVDRSFLQLKPPQQWVSEWHLEILAKEIILNGRNYAERGRTLRSWSTFAGTINKLKNFEDSIPTDLNPDISGLLILNRIAHQQFIWQDSRPNSATCSRYYLIFDTPEINEICFERLGISVSDLYLCGMALIGALGRNPAIALPLTSEIPGLSRAAIENFIALNCRQTVEFKSGLKETQCYDETFFYAYNPLRANPLVGVTLKNAYSIICPLLTLLFWKFTGGLYYDLITDMRFSNALGKSFQNYVGEVIHRACPGEKVLSFPEQSYRVGRDRKDTVDWITADAGAALFLECKSKRLSWSAKITVNDLSPLEADIGLMADAVVQTYKTIEDHERGRYPHFPFDPDRRIYPVVVTLENWHLFGPVLLPMLRKAVIARLSTAKIEPTVLDQKPFSIWHIGDLEWAMQIIAEVGITPFFDGKLRDAEMSDWEWRSYMSQSFGKRIVRKALFDDKYDSIFARVFSRRAEPRIP
jgi:hypothetical protein